VVYVVSGIRVVPIPTTQIENAAGKFGTWLWEARREHNETNPIIRQALRMSLCRYGPYGPGVDSLAAYLEDRMWKVAQRVPDRTVPAKKFVLWVRAGGWFRHRIKAGALDFPRWEAELRAWVKAASDGVDLAPANTCQGLS
jgi:hypothetical protein